MNRKILFVIISLAFLGYVGYSFMDSVTPYVGIAEAESSKSNVQVKGLLAFRLHARGRSGRQDDGSPLPRAEAGSV